ncbi:hypothetical protein PCANC_15995 [Puccinia coronata f. sp. avenae]|uniref:Prenyltransferase alpha-alpha toroid domain-containing protein n=1 Tax=Puccinia coronata f. sp. avenae TaxID=200324 RepID=A0A2N5RWL4_9BASI|nr:hypothetical protein PCASD_26367 [Puccinia coronata f. sp. avenae]PLW52714.1 hypothetical protein PCANC_15995 [Puccinia coronata f. sp. avenae]
MVSDDQAAELAQPSHIRYALRHLRMLPPPYQSDDSNRITFAFFALGSLAILGGLDRLDLAERTDYISWIYRRWNPEIGGFGGAPNIDLRGLGPDEEPYDQPHLTHTYTALLILALLTVPSSEAPGPESPYAALDVPKLLRFVRNCQRPNGSFGSFPNSLEEDVRFVYCAVAILAIVRVTPDTVIDVDSTERFLKSCRRYEGGYGQAPYAEAQGGTTYCALASLSLLGRLESSQTEEEISQTVRWLVDRQGELVHLSESLSESDGSQGASPVEASQSELNASGASGASRGPIGPGGDVHPLAGFAKARPTVAGFQGRIGKPLDACYSFWCTASLTILSGQFSGPGPHPPLPLYPPPKANESQFSTPPLYRPRANIEFLLRCQSNQWGGIARAPGDHPDVYHTYLALASLSLSGHAATFSESRNEADGGSFRGVDQLTEHDPLLNVPVKVSQWMRLCFSCNKNE